MYVYVIGSIACNSNPCQHDGRCDNTAQGFHCKCKGIYVGLTCARMYYAITVMNVAVYTDPYAIAHARAYITHSQSLPHIGHSCDFNYRYPGVSVYHC